MRVIVWLLRGFLFFVLFAFALNNQQTVVVHWFFGIDWSAPLVIVVLIAFAAGTGLGVMAMLPAWWRLRRRAQPSKTTVASTAPVAPATRNGAPSGFDAEPSRDVW
jgi:lipopolysaccharide assembly protein A